MEHKGVFCDTSFFIRLLDRTDPLHANAKGYFKYLAEHDFELYISTIAIAEFCVRGNVHELPLKNLQIVPFNLDHAKRTGEFAKIAFQNKGKLKLNERHIIPNDTKLFAQADVEKAVEFYLSSDSESLKIYRLIQNHASPRFQFIDLNTPHNETFGILDL